MTDINDAEEKVIQDIKKAEQVQVPVIVKEKQNEEQIVEVLPPVASTTKAKVTDATFKSTSVALIEKLLQFSTPRLDSKIVNVLFLEGKKKKKKKLFLE
jgi:3-dehydroquinate dehydratase